jgi:hypothetical protein
MKRQQTALLDNDNRKGAPSMLHFPHAAYMVAATCQLGGISNMPDPKTNEKI